MKKHRIVIADDHNIFRDGLRSLLEQEGSFEIVAEATDGLDAIRCIQKHVPDLLITDLSMPRMSGMSVIHDIRSRFPEVKIVVLTVHDTEEYYREVFKTGADGFCVKKENFNDVCRAIKMVLQGKSYISPYISRPILDSLTAAPPQDPTKTAWDTLTLREKDVLKLVGEGYKNKEIADLLHISPKTVEKHRSNLMAKLDMHSAQALTTYAIQMGLVLPKA